MNWIIFVQTTSAEPRPKFSFPMVISIKSSRCGWVSGRLFPAHNSGGRSQPWERWAKQPGIIRTPGGMRRGLHFGFAGESKERMKNINNRLGRVFASAMRLQHREAGAGRPASLDFAATGIPGTNFPLNFGVLWGSWEQKGLCASLLGRKPNLEEEWLLYHGLLQGEES